MINNRVAIDDYVFRYNKKGICHVKYKGKLIHKFSVFEEIEEIDCCVEWCVVDYPGIEGNRLDMLYAFIRGAVDEYGIYGKFV